MAAAFGVGIVLNRPFLDGNERTGSLMAAAFLESNGFELVATDRGRRRLLALAAGEADEADYAAWLGRTVGAVEAPRTSPTR
jgi:death-on-curing protein